MNLRLHFDIFSCFSSILSDSQVHSKSNSFTHFFSLFLIEICLLANVFRKFDNLLSTMLLHTHGVFPTFDLIIVLIQYNVFERYILQELKKYNCTKSYCFHYLTNFLELSYYRKRFPNLIS